MTLTSEQAAEHQRQRLILWVYNNHRRVYEEYIHDPHAIHMGRFLKDKHPAIWVEWRMSQ